MKTVQVSFLGLGVIGLQLLKYIIREREGVRKQYGVELQINKIFVKNLSKDRGEVVEKEWLTDRPYEAMEHADLIVECIGGNGYKCTKDYVMWALNHRKPVIMSSKKCLAMYGTEIQKAAEKMQTVIKYDATVGGGIPISTVLEHMGKCEQVEEIYGISNATSNYILTKMKQENMSYKEALQEAQKQGIAENNPKEDVDGWDSVYKTVILAGFGMNVWINPQEVTPVSITHSKVELDQMVKPIFSVVYDERKRTAHVKVKPEIVEAGSILSCVNGTDNLFVIRGSESGERAFYGAGAGARPTASAMFDDMIKVLEDWI
ncbi:MAG: homoserine dehydrogenase [bacterium]|nr:homoserine dehydrogenase [bacterium]